MTTSPPAAGRPEIRNSDMLALKAYIQAKDATQYENVHASTVILDLSHSNLVQEHIEIRFDKHDTVTELRRRIHLKTGTSPAFQHLQLKSGGHVVHEIPPDQDGDSFQLGYFGVHHGMRVHCVDLDPNSGSRDGRYENVALVEKYRMSDAEYDRRKGTLRDWGRERKAADASFSLAKHAQRHRELVDAQRQHRMGLPLPEHFFVDATGKVVRDDGADEPMRGQGQENESEEISELFGMSSVDGILVGERCQVEPGARRGKVAYVGEVPELKKGGHWVGVVFDEPVGKTDGTAGEKRYFEAMPKCGGFVRGKNVQVGDFPERDLFDEDEDSDEDEI